MIQGYYSLIQYCPDWTRLEVCNIGVMLFCPECRFLDVMMTRKNKRIQTIFGKEHSLDHIRTFKDSFAERIRTERSRILELEALKNFIATRANSFLITEPRSIAVSDPEQELSGLFEEVFGEPSKSTKEKPVSVKERFYEALQKKLGADLNQRVWTKFPRIEVPIPGFRQTIQPVAGFLNGAFNLVIERKLTPENSFKTMSCDMMIGRFIHEKKSSLWGEQRLIILAEMEGRAEVRKQVETFRPMMQDNKTEILETNKAVATISKESKPLPKYMLEYLSKKQLLL